MSNPGFQIHAIRGNHVVLDSDLAALYRVTTGNFNKAIRRNIERFPEDFSFVLTKPEFEELIFQIGRSSSRGGRRTRPRVFTEHGAIMAANVLNSRRAVEASVFVVRAFVRLRRTLATHHDLARKLEELEQRVGAHDDEIRDLVAAIRRLAEPPPVPPRRRIGFHRDAEGG